MAGFPRGDRVQRPELQKGIQRKEFISHEKTNKKCGLRIRITLLKTIQSNKQKKQKQKRIPRPAAILGRVTKIILIKPKLEKLN